MSSGMAHDSARASGKIEKRALSGALRKTVELALAAEFDRAPCRL